MKGIPVLVATLLVSGVLALAQVCPTGYPQTFVPGSTPSTVTVPGTVMVPGYGTVPYASLPYGSMTYGTQPYGMQQFGVQPYGMQCFGTQPYGMQQFGMQPYGIQCSGIQPYGMQQFSLQPTTGYLPYSGMTASTGVSSLCPGGTSSDTACVINEIRALRGEVASIMLVSQGQMLTNRLNQLMASEIAFRQAIAANPNLPNAQLIALHLNMEAQALNRDISAFTRTLSMITPEQRPFVASSLNTFDVVYWQPALQAFSAYQAQLPAAQTMYQPALVQNPWLQNWFASYQTALVPLSQSSQVIASVRWWGQPMVLGTAEVYPGTFTPPTMISTLMLPSGAVVFIPAGVVAGTVESLPVPTTLPAPTTVPAPMPVPAPVPAPVIVPAPAPPTGTTTY